MVRRPSRWRDNSSILGVNDSRNICVNYWRSGFIRDEHNSSKRIQGLMIEQVINRICEWLTGLICESYSRGGPISAFWYFVITRNFHGIWIKLRNISEPSFYSEAILSGFIQIEGESCMNCNMQTWRIHFVGIIHPIYNVSVVSLHNYFSHLLSWTAQKHRPWSCCLGLRN